MGISLREFQNNGEQEHETCVTISVHTLIMGLPGLAQPNAEPFMVCTNRF